MEQHEQNIRATAVQMAMALNAKVDGTNADIGKIMQDAVVFYEFVIAGTIKNFADKKSIITPSTADVATAAASRPVLTDA